MFAQKDDFEERRKPALLFMALLSLGTGILLSIMTFIQLRQLAPYKKYGIVTQGEVTLWQRPIQNEYKDSYVIIEFPITDKKGIRRIISEKWNTDESLWKSLRAQKRKIDLIYMPEKYYDGVGPRVRLKAYFDTIVGSSRYTKSVIVILLGFAFLGVWWKMKG